MITVLSLVALIFAPLFALFSLLGQNGVDRSGGCCWDV